MTSEGSVLELVDSKIPAGPAARRLARRRGVELGAVRGSGRGGRILRDDVLAGKASPSRPTPAAPVDPPVTILPAVEWPQVTIRHLLSPSQVAEFLRDLRKPQEP